MLARRSALIWLLLCALLLSGQPAATAGGSRLDRGGPDDDPAAAQQWYYGQRAAPFAHIPPGAWLRSLQQRAAVPAFSPRAAGRLVGPFVVPSAGWTPIGPAPEHAEDVAYYSYNNGDAGGRVTALAYDAKNGILYAGLADGGVWKTTDSGTTWTALTDAQPSLAIGALALDPNNPSIIYAGTGEENFSGDAYYSAGILKSTDGGATWTLYGQSTFGGGYRTDRYHGVHIGKIVVDPHNSQHVLVASDQGVYLSTDGGQTYAPTLRNTRLNGSTITDLIVDPSTNPSIVYAAWGDPSGVGDNGIYKSTNGGATFPTPGYPTGTGYPKGTGVGRIALAEAAPGGQLYMTAAATIASGAASLGVWTSSNHGTNWIQVTPSHANGGPDLFGGDGLQEEQGWYDIYIAVDPGNAGTVYVGGVNIFKSTNGGCTTTKCLNFADITNVYNSNTSAFRPHPDQHAIVFTNSASTSSFIAGNDGGVYGSTDGGASFTDNNGNLAGLQFYGGSTTGNFTSNRVVYGGMQDNGTGKYTGTSDWSMVYGGDGGYTANDPGTPNNAFEEYTYLQINATTDGGASWSPATNGINTSEKKLFIAPYIMDPMDANHLLAGTTHVYQTTDGASTWASGAGRWTRISPSLPASTSNFFGAVSALAIAPSDHTNTFYAGTGDGVIWRTTNGSAATPTWTRITPASSLGVSGRYVTSLAVYAGDARDVIATFSGFATNTGTGIGTHVLRSTDGGATWTDVSKLLPDSPVTSVVRNPSSATTFYVGADDGFFFTTDAGAHWTQYQAGLPNAGIDQLFSDAGFTTLFAATHGRGMWTLPTSAFATPGLLASPATRTFNALQGGANPPSQTVQLSAVVSPIDWAATINYTAGTPGWLAAVPSSGTALTPGSPAKIALSATPGCLADGVYQAQVVFTATANASDTATVDVAFVISGPVSCTPTATVTPTSTPTGTATSTPTATDTPVPPTATTTNTPTNTNTPTSTATNTPTNTPVPPSDTPTDTLTNTSTATDTPTATSTPTSKTDTVGTCDENTLRSVISGAAPGDTVAFGCSGTITLTSGGGGAITLGKNLTIDGSEQSVTISGGGSVQVFVVASGANVTLNDLTIANGSAGVGGGILNNSGGTLSVTNSTFSGNSAGEGGGIANGGTLSVADSTFNGNTTPTGPGGGIYSASGANLTVTNSTFSGNHATRGGGIANDGPGTVTNSTFSGNVANGGGGIDDGGSITLVNTILANSSGHDCSGLITDQGGNFADDGSCGFTQGSSTNNAIGLNLDPNGLQNNGGPTQTIALQPGSIAIDVTTCRQPTDQRGMPRPDGTESICDSGAYEVQD